MVRTNFHWALVLKNWHADYWEICAGIKNRILFELTDHITFLFVGNHEKVEKGTGK